MTARDPPQDASRTRESYGLTDTEALVKAYTDQGAFLANLFLTDILVNALMRCAASVVRIVTLLLGMDPNLDALKRSQLSCFATNLAQIWTQHRRRA